MPAYFLVDVLEVTDPAKIEEYKRRVGPVVEKFGGQYLAAGGRTEVLEGSWRPTLPVLIQFPSFEQAQRWYASDEYRGLKALRLAATRCTAVLFDGLG